MFEQADLREGRSVLVDWILRAVPADTIMSGGILIGLVVFWRSRRTR